MQRARLLKYIYGFQEALKLCRCFFVIYYAILREVDATGYVIYNTSVKRDSEKNL
jgi:hypothetical protein